MNIFLNYLLILAFLLSLIFNDFEGITVLKTPLIALFVIVIIVNAIIDIKKKVKKTKY